MCLKRLLEVVSERVYERGGGGGVSQGGYCRLHDIRTYPTTRQHVHFIALMKYQRRGR